MSNMNIPCMGFKTRKIYLNQLDVKDKTFLLSYGYDIQPLKESIGRVGLINPPIVRKKSDDAYQIVCGYKRALALKQLGVSSLQCAVLPDQRTDDECLLLNIYDNVSHRELNPIEKSIAINKLKTYYTEEDIVHNFLPALKLQPHITQLNVFTDYRVWTDHDIFPEFRPGMYQGRFMNLSQYHHFILYYFHSRDLLITHMN